MLIHVHGVLVLPTMPVSELSHVRTEFERRRIVTTIPPHPVQPNCHPATHRYLGNAPVPTHRQVYVPTPPVRVEACGRLRSLHRHVATRRGRACPPAKEAFGGRWFLLEVRIFIPHRRHDPARREPPTILVSGERHLTQSLFHFRQGLTADRFRGRGDRNRIPTF